MSPRARVDDEGALLFTHDCGARTRVDQRLPLWAGGWTIEQMDPLTISPSIWCRACGTHGYIREGLWVTA